METLIRHIDINSEKHSKATLAGIYNNENGNLTLGLSLCSKKDQYNRKVGNSIAINRATYKPFIKVNVGLNKRRKDVLVHLFSFTDIENYLKIQFQR